MIFSVLIALPLIIADCQKDGNTESAGVYKIRYGFLAIVGSDRRAPWVHRQSPAVAVVAVFF